jgi:hypothetical protein
VIANGSSGRVIFTDIEDAQAEYSVYVSDTNLFPPDFDMAFFFLQLSHVTK